MRIQFKKIVAADALATSRAADGQQGASRAALDATEVLRSIIQDGYLSDTNTARGHAALARAPLPAQAPDPVVEANRKLLLDRSRVGIEKYGVTLAAAGHSREVLLQHALEEALDLANYLQALLHAKGL